MWGWSLRLRLIRGLLIEGMVRRYILPIKAYAEQIDRELAGIVDEYVRKRLGEIEMPV